MLCRTRQMMRHRSGIQTGLLAGLMLWTAIAHGQEKKAEENQVKGTVTKVTLYRGQALVTRSVPVAGAAGPQELVVTGLPVQIVDSSLFAEGENLEVRAVRYRTRAVAAEPDEAIREIDLKIVTATENLAKINEYMQLLGEKKKYLDQLEGFVGQVGKQDLQEARLDAEELQKLTTFIFNERKTLMEERLQAGADLKTTQEQLTLLQRKRNEVGSSATKTIREAVVFVSKADANDATLTLNYLVANAGWSPAYNVRANTNEEGLRLEYHALIYQLTGEEWKNVSLTLSTATPALSSATPSLAPLRVSLSKQPSPMEVAQVQNAPNQKALVETYSRYNTLLNDAQMAQNRVQSLTGNFDNNWKLNDAANGIQILEIVNSGEALRALKTNELAGQQAPAIDYQLESGVSLASRSDQQMVRILQRELPTEYYHVATPLLSQYVYREAEVKNTTDSDLLGGPVTAYLNGRFVGKAEIPTVARGQQFVIGLGADSQLRVNRELVEKSEDIQGGNKELTFEYRIALQNFKDQPVTVRTYERLPVARGEADITVTLGDSMTPLSKDAAYLRTERTKGILRWDVAVAANATDEMASTVEYSWTVEFDKQFHLSTNSNTAQLKNEFEQLERVRGKF